MAQDALLELTQVRSRFEAQLLKEARPGALVRGERFGLATAGVERSHELTPSSLPERCRGHGLRKCRHDVVAGTEREHRLGAIVDRCVAHFHEPGALRRGERGVGDVGVRLTAPQAERVVERGQRLPGHTAGECGAAHASERLEAHRVDGVRRDVQRVAAGRRANDRAAEPASQT